jgi:tRNA uridine 5-carbamoylmethylation protein Kti12
MSSTELGDRAFKQEEPEKGSQEVGETRTEPVEAPEVSQRLEQATFDPEEVVEHDGDYKQAETIEAAFVKVIEAPVPQKTTDGSTDEGSGSDDNSSETEVPVDIETLAQKVLFQTSQDEEQDLNDTLDETHKMNEVKSEQREKIDELKKLKAEATQKLSEEFNALVGEDVTLAPEIQQQPVQYRSSGASETSRSEESHPPDSGGEQTGRSDDPSIRHRD